MERLGRIEESVTAVAAKLDQRRRTDDVLSVFSDGLAVYRRRVLDEKDAIDADADRHRVVGRMIKDQALGFPHRKIVERLLDRHDPGKGEFLEVPFNQLVSTARVGKSRAKNYLALLERRRYVERRDDGYRKWFRIRPEGP